MCKMKRVLYLFIYFYMCAKTHSKGNASMHMHTDTSEVCCNVLCGHINTFFF